MQNAEAITMVNMDTRIKYQVVESYKKIRNNIILSLQKNGNKTIVVSSSLPSEGKSTVSVNLAISLSQTDAKVLIIDADLRKPKINRFFGLTNTVGLTDILNGFSSIDEAVKKTKYENLDLLCSGHTVNNPSELLMSKQIIELLNKFQSIYEYIIITVSPLNIASDALSLIKYSNGFVWVVRQNISKRNEMDKTLQDLKFIDANIIGFVLNGVTVKKKRNILPKKNRHTE